MTTAHPPSVERILAAARPRLGEREHDAVVAEARQVVEAERARLAEVAGTARTSEALAAALVARLDSFGTPASAPAPAGAAVVNATGVLLHTNLGRAPWPEAAIRAAAEVARSASFLELDEDSGRRGKRARAAEEHVVALTGAESGLVLNNNGGALAVAVGLAGRGGVAVSRGELVEIGGGVRIPDIVKRAGARLVEVGTTNRTRVEDFADLLASGAARLVLRVHPSNFVQSGFVESPDDRALAKAAHAHGAIVVDDLGSGALLDTAAFGLGHERTPREALEAGADLVCFSGDKLVGGPQAGILAGRADLIARIRRDPLARAMRPDKTLLAAMTATLGLHRAGLATREIPVWRRIAAPVDALEARALAIVDAVRAAGPGGSDAGLEVVPSVATIGGGSLPGQALPSRALAIRAGSADALLARLRAGGPAVVGRIEDDRVLLDLRTVDPAEDAGLATALAAALAER
jgi:L-seryl-tRNA(Ser) seleniumtransferase